MRLFHWSLALLPALASAYERTVSDKDYSRQVCSGMWAGPKTGINVSFDATSQGSLAVVIYEWSDSQYLGKVTSKDEDLPRTYVCTTNAVRKGLCDASILGKFILNLPQNKSVQSTSFWSARVALSMEMSTNSTNQTRVKAGSAFWDDPNGNPTPPEGDAPATPWKRDGIHVPTPSPNMTLVYSQSGPIHYHVYRTGYYCVAIVPVTVISTRRAPTDVPFHPSYTGSVLFMNKFDGQLPASDYPKVNFYLIMFIAYLTLGAAWGWICWQNRDELLPIQYYLSSLVGFLVIEMVASWVYYRYMNAHGRSSTSTVFLFVVAILDAGRNALSFFLLLVVSLGLSVVRESLGRNMIRCQILAGLHFIFGVLYAVGIVELELESTSAIILLLFIIPLAFTLSGFLMWIMYSLNATIAHLRARKQRFKLSMFTRLYHILLFAVAVIISFFFVSFWSFSDRLAEDYAARSWRSRWWLLDGWLALLYFACFWAIAYLWRPTMNNRRLAMSDEIAQDEQEAEDYDLEALEHRDGDEDTLVDRQGLSAPLAEDVVFEIGDEDDEDETPRKKPGTKPLAQEVDAP